MSKIQRVFKNKDIRRLVDNFFSLSALKLINLILPLVTLPYLIKVLGFHYYGAIVLAMSLIMYFQAVTDYGFNLSATREIAKHKHSKKQLNFIYSKTLWSKFTLLILSLVVLIPIICFIPQFREDSLIFYLMCLTLIGHTMFPEWFFRGIERMRYITILDLSVKISFTIGVFLFIHKPQDYWIYPVLFGCGYLLSALIAYYIIYKHFSIQLRLVRVAQVKTTLYKGSPLFVNQFMPNFYNNTTNFLVGLLLGNYAAGVFGAIRQIVNLLNVFNSVVSTVVFPYLVRNKDKFYIYSKYYIGFFVLLAICAAFIYPWVFQWIGITDKQASVVFLILISGVTSVVVYHIYATNYLIARGYDRVVMKITITVSILGLIASYPLITAFGLIGGAANIFSCQFLLATTAFIMFKKIENQKTQYIGI
ncbi:oligosaccharide flippase family protein [Acinetobacter pseudolwoffii]|uniref:oligosaccharide flippase family protein n=1 Tax=Acinetobacter pseudolwoffii TaxID=2053287 RepID=UPI00209A6BB6|nr:oligosaccharide flippase family protein [Acinetobacter pseudolwoffii]MCO8091496.1 oligosaccharide flippase family protein [Acinetobacter pseudolwoffii]